MKITKTEPILITVPYSYGGSKQTDSPLPFQAMQTLLLKVETDEGITGWGEGFGFGVSAVTKLAIQELVAPLAIGRDPRDIGGLMNTISKKLHNYGRNGPVSYALSALDIALWDIAGQIVQKPLHILLGGQPTKTMPLYASLLRYGDPALVARYSSEAANRGYMQIKLHEIREIDVAAARKEVGNDIILMIDANCRWTAEEAISTAKCLVHYDLLWIEEPVWPPDNYRGIARVTEETTIATAAGENGGTLGDMVALINFAKVNFIQPSVTKIGGVTTMMQIAEVARSSGTSFAPHSPYFGPGLIATAHICAALPERPTVERFYCELEGNPLGEQMSVKNGCINIPQGPGLGLHLDDSILHRYRVG